MARHHLRVARIGDTVPAGSPIQPNAQGPSETAGTRLKLGSDEASLDSPESKYRSFHEDFRDLLVCLAPFTGTIHRGTMDLLLTNLKQQPPLAPLARHRWEEALALAWDRGLLRPHPADPAFAVVAPDLVASLRHRLERFFQPEMRQAMDKAFYLTYCDAARSICQLLESGVPTEVQRGKLLMSLEYENMLTVIPLGLVHREQIGDMYAAMHNYLMQAGHYQRGVELGEKVLALLNQHSPAGADDRRLERAAVICGIADHQEMLGRHEAAEVGYQKALALCTGHTDTPTPENQRFLGMIYHKLGLLAYQQRRWKPAEEHLEKALGIRIEINDRVKQAETLRSLGRVAAKIHNWPQAKQAYRKAMDLYASLGNRLSQAKVCVDLASAASDCERVDEAKRHFHQALAFFVEFGEKAQEAAVHHNLGDIAQDEYQYKRAWKHYRKAVRIFYEVGTRTSQHRSYSRLGVLMARARQGRMAELFHRRALRLAWLSKDRFTEALAYHQLGDLCPRCRQWERAAAYYGKAMEILRVLRGLLPPGRYSAWTWAVWLTNRGDGPRARITCLLPYGSLWAARMRRPMIVP